MKTEDLKTILQFIDKNDKQIKEEVIGDLSSLKESVFTLIHQLKEDIQNDPILRGPPGFSGRDGEQGPQGPSAIGERGPMGPMPVIDIDYQSGRIRLQTGISENNGMNIPMFSEWINVKGERGDTLTWHDLTESQRQMLIGPRGDQGAQGNPGKFPQMQADPANRRVRFQVTEDVMNPWGEWLDIPKGDQGEQGVRGEIGEAFKYEMFTEEQLRELVGPQGEQGLQGLRGDEGSAATVSVGLIQTVPHGSEVVVENVGTPNAAILNFAIPTGQTGTKGDKGDKGDQGETGAKGDKGDQGEKGDKGDPGIVDMAPINKEVESIKATIKDSYQKFEVKSTKKITNDFEKVKNELTNKIDNVRFTRLNELLIPTQAFNVAGDPTGSEVVQEIGPFDNWNDIVDGSPVYIDNPIKASLRGEVYNPNDYIVYADASDVVNVADGIIFKGVGRYAYIYRIGVAKIDPRVIEDGPELVPGEYYYLSHPKEGMAHGQITSNKPQFGVAQLVGQAISKDKLFVNCTTDPVVLNRTEMRIQGSQGSYLQAPATAEGNPGDAFGDVVWTNTHMYTCTRDYDGVSKIWKRTAFDLTWGA